jgi:hypothetical protein
VALLGVTSAYSRDLVAWLVACRIAGDVPEATLGCA